MYGEDGNDLIYGNAGDDTLYGGKGDDSLSGGDGYDGLYGDAGDDILYGGEGYDKFYIVSDTGYDVIKDFNVEQDYIGLVGDLTYENIQLTQLGSSTVISSSDQELAILTSINSQQLTADNFGQLNAF
ncbi:MAG: hypothetical protein AAGE84_16480 [Cyanobacteria bacterium P01_G01_bin.39]